MKGNIDKFINLRQLILIFSSSNALPLIIFLMDVNFTLFIFFAVRLYFLFSPFFWLVSIAAFDA
jgi:hypothetical protein